MEDINKQREILCAGGNLYRTNIKMDNDYLTLTQRRIIPAIAVGCIAALGYYASPWVGIPLIIATILILVWDKSLRISLTGNEVLAVSGVPPLQRQFKGGRENVNYVELREVTMRKNTDSEGKWRTYDVNIHAFDGRVDFSVWEESDETKTRDVAEALAAILQCEIKEVMSAYQSG